MDRDVIIAHLSMFMACAIWGLMAPLGKDAMLNGIDGISMVSFRVAGGAALFWLSSIFLPHENVPLKDKFLFALASIFGIVCNQCCFTIGLSITSPINASIATTSMPIFAMFFSFIILREAITLKKVLGIIVGCCGAVILIISSARSSDIMVGDVRGDLLVLGTQLSYAFFLALFNNLIKKYSVFTVNKWMFLWATIFLWPFTFCHVAQISWMEIMCHTWLETIYVVVLGTYAGYIFIVIAQKKLTPIIVSIYNYIQPLISVVVTVLMGIGVFKSAQIFAIILVFFGVWLVTISRTHKNI